MSPTVLLFSNLRVAIHTKDHKPAHIHVIGPNAEAKFSLGSWDVLESGGFSKRALSRIRAFLQPREAEFWEVWNEIHEKEKD